MTHIIPNGDLALLFGILAEHPRILAASHLQLHADVNVVDACCLVRALSLGLLRVYVRTQERNVESVSNCMLMRVCVCVCVCGPSQHRQKTFANIQRMNAAAMTAVSVRY